VQPEDGIWKQRYYADGLEAPSWATHQLDETGTVLWALDQHLHSAFDATLMDRGLEAAVRAYRREFPQRKHGPFGTDGAFYYVKMEYQR